jgi:molybdopterin-containing oxidoreductase family iron-sulfur binding subunit
MNAALGNVGTTVIYTETAEAEPTDQVQSLRNLVDDMTAGRVDALIILGGNPVYTAPADLSLDTAMSKVAFRVHLGLTRTRHPRSATGRSPKPTFSNRGAMREVMTAPPRSCSR